MMLRKRRMKRGSLELSMPELTIDLNHDGQVTGAHLEEDTESHQNIEEFMLSANEAVAEMLADNGLLFLRRVSQLVSWLHNQLTIQASNQLQPLSSPHP